MTPQTYFTNQIKSQTFPIILFFCKRIVWVIQPLQYLWFGYKGMCFAKHHAFCYLPSFEIWFEPNIQTTQRVQAMNLDSLSPLLTRIHLKVWSGISQQELLCSLVGFPSK